MAATPVPDLAASIAGVRAYLDAVASYRTSLTDPRLAPGDVVAEQLPSAIVTASGAARTVPLRESHLRALLAAAGGAGSSA